MNLEERIVEVDKEFYSKLAEYLQPEERFTPPINTDDPHGLILFVGYNYSTIRRLIFVPKEKGK